MKLIVKLVISALVILIAAYYGSAYIMPSVSIVNNSGSVIELAEVTLPNSNLNFGEVKNGDTNTLHYALKQNDGVYNYQLKSKNAVVFSGSCGYVTNNQFTKRVVITLKNTNEVVCE
jgi:hypothetical protein